MSRSHVVERGYRVKKAFLVTNTCLEGFESRAGLDPKTITILPALKVQDTHERQEGHTQNECRGERREEMVAS